ncbi:hypothetical protein F5148DRAFT_975292 [Russula earlei]|uniref:Uncharacterized protein n=1 Tax=Russula earlei TaxID=71964 RepID=A0ACC0UJX5_9AGAM|nr:hypothetical protein F5148DRAFT_975292 [Russula earlei]
MPSPPPLDPSLLVLDPHDEAFFKATTKIDDTQELRDHIRRVAKEAFEVFPYCTIGSYTFARTTISRLSGYAAALAVGVGNGGILLDAGSCFGADARKAEQDGWPTSRIVATDIVPEFWELGHKLFRSSTASFPATFIKADLLDETDIAPGPPSMDAPDLENLTSLNHLRGHVTAIHASALFHLFSEERQRSLALALGSLLAPVSGASIFGWSTGREEVGYSEFEGKVSHPRQFCHSPSSWEALWDGIVFPKGTVTVEAHLGDFDHDVGLRLKGGLPPKRLDWVVRRI